MSVHIGVIMLVLYASQTVSSTVQTINIPNIAQGSLKRLSWVILIKAKFSFREHKNGNMWDCDIYIKSLKIAILLDRWYWYYSLNVSKKQKTRDILKRKIILNNGSTYYTIIDKGKFNKEFVKEQFNLFIHKNCFKNVIKCINSLFL